jgi:multidrug efflux pump subunit AcrA (membrane-fusion protein)
MTESSRPATADRRLAALFPEAGGAASAPPWWRRRSGVAVIVLVVGALVVSGLVAASAFGSSGDSYRMATASTENVDAVLTGVATIEPVAQASVAFPVSGAVASVNVQIGQPVVAGGTLASLDTQSLVRTLHAKQAALAQAQLTLSKALSGQSVGGLGATTGASGSGSTGAPSATSSAFRTVSSGDRIVLTAATVDPQVAAASQAVLAAQQVVDTALAAASTASSAETTVCASFTTPPPTSTTTPATPPDVTACQQAINGVTQAQRDVTSAQQALATASKTLDGLLAQLASAPPVTPTPTTATPSTRSGATGSGGAGSGASTSTSTSSSARSSSSGSGSSPSAADLVAYQQAVDAASAAVAVAQQSVDQATIGSPLAGTVVAVNLKVGDAVSADSSTANVVVQGTGGYEVTTTVSVDEIPSVSVGQSASVHPDGSRDVLPGRVVAISVAPASTSTSTTLYRVTIGLTDPKSRLDNGATGSVSIVTKDAKAALAVPTSAVTTMRNRHYVSVLSGGTLTLTPVQTGVVGGTWTEIKRGVHDGEQVVLADRSSALPSSATTSSNSTTGTSPFGGFGRFTGGGGAGAGRGNRTG